MTFEDLLKIQPYSLVQKEKEKLLDKRLMELTKFHQKNCPEYKCILDSIDFGTEQCQSYVDIPFLPVRLFKELELKSIPDE